MGRNRKRQRKKRIKTSKNSVKIESFYFMIVLGRSLCSCMKSEAISWNLSIIIDTSDQPYKDNVTKQSLQDIRFFPIVFVRKMRLVILVVSLKRPDLNKK